MYLAGKKDILFGWFMGAFTPEVIGMLKKRAQRKKLTGSILGELLDLQYSMAVVAYLMRADNSSVTDDFLRWMLTILDRYEGKDLDQRLLLSLRDSQELPESVRAEMHRQLKKPNTYKTVKEFSLPFLHAQLGEIATLRFDVQRDVLRVDSKVDVYNQQVRYLHAMAERTFNPSVEGKNRESVIENVSSGYTQLGTMAYDIAILIEDFRTKVVPEN
jgi:hypothetical protein